MRRLITDRARSWITTIRNTVFSSIDQGGRYAYANQPAIAQWNLARFAETLLPLIDSDSDKAIRFATEVIEPFIARFDAQFLEGMRHKIGLASALQDDAELVNRLLATMKDAEADFTLTFRRLALAAERPGNETPLRELFAASCGIDNWLQDWRQRAGSGSAKRRRTSGKHAARERGLHSPQSPR